MTDKQSLSDQQLDDLLHQAKRADTTPSPKLMARIIADADQVANQRNGLKKPRPARRGRSGFRALLDGFGGWPALAGLTTATLAGVWIGYATDQTLPGLSAGIISTDIGYDIGEFMADFDMFADEG